MKIIGQPPFRSNWPRDAVLSPLQQHASDVNTHERVERAVSKKQHQSKSNEKTHQLPTQQARLVYLSSLYDYCRIVHCHMFHATNNLCKQLLVTCANDKYKVRVATHLHCFSFSSAVSEAASRSSSSWKWLGSISSYFLCPHLFSASSLLLRGREGSRSKKVAEMSQWRLPSQSKAQGLPFGLNSSQTSPLSSDVVS